jgi:hypothetical protein
VNRNERIRKQENLLVVLAPEFPQLSRKEALGINHSHKNPVVFSIAFALQAITSIETPVSILFMTSPLFSAFVNVIDRILFLQSCTPIMYTPILNEAM